MTNLRFREDGSFRVLQMADIQDGPNVLPDTIRLIREAIRKADPDLVVFTGDQIRGTILPTSTLSCAAVARNRALACVRSPKSRPSCAESSGGPETA